MVETVGSSSPEPRPPHGNPSTFRAIRWSSPGRPARAGRGVPGVVPVHSGGYARAAAGSSLAPLPSLLRRAQLREDPPRILAAWERDEFDEHSVQGFLRHRPSGLVVGTVRLVLHKPGARFGMLPIHKVCQDRRVHDPDHLPIARTCGSLVLPSPKCSGDVLEMALTAAPIPDALADDPRRMIPHITLGLMTESLCK